MADDEPPRIKATAYFTEADIAAAARHAVARRKNRDGSPVTQDDVARVFGTSQALVSQALGFDSPTARVRSSTQRGAALRRRIVRAWGDGGGVRFAGPYYRAVGPDDDDTGPGRFPPDRPPFDMGNGSPLPDDDDTKRGHVPKDTEPD